MLASVLTVIGLAFSPHVRENEVPQTTLSGRKSGAPTDLVAVVTATRDSRVPAFRKCWHLVVRVHTGRPVQGGDVGLAAF